MNKARCWAGFYSFGTMKASAGGAGERWERTGLKTRHYTGAVDRLANAGDNSLSAQWERTGLKTRHYTGAVDRLANAGDNSLSAQT